MPLSLNKTPDSTSPCDITRDLISKTKILFTESNDEYGFISSLLEKLNIKNEIQIIKIGKQCNFNSALKLKKKERGFNFVTHIGIVFNANKSKEETYREIRKSLKQNEISLNDRITTFAKAGTINLGIHIISKPGHNEGSLDDLFLSTHTDSPIYKHAENYLDNLSRILKKHEPDNKNKDPEPLDFNYPRNETRAKSRALIAGFYDDVPSVGNASQRGYVDFEHENLQDIKKFLEEFNNLT